MKQLYFQAQTKKQTPKDDSDVPSASFQKASPLPLPKRGDWEQIRTSYHKKNEQPPNRAFFPPPSEGGQGGGSILCKGPPGRSRSPGAKSDPEHPPDGGAGTPDVFRPDRFQKPVRSIEKTEYPLKAKSPHRPDGDAINQRSLSVRLSSRRSLVEGNTHRISIF
jgi:hypothetical protein